MCRSYRSYRCTSYTSVVKGFLCVLGCFTYLGPWVSLFILCFLVYFLLFVLSCQYQCKWLPVKTRLRNDLLFVELDVKLYSVTHATHFRKSIFISDCWNRYSATTGHRRPTPGRGVATPWPFFTSPTDPWQPPWSSSSLGKLYSVWVKGKEYTGHWSSTLLHGYRTSFTPSGTFWGLLGWAREVFFNSKVVLVRISQALNGRYSKAMLILLF